MTGALAAVLAVRLLARCRAGRRCAARRDRGCRPALGRRGVHVHAPRREPFAGADARHPRAVHRARGRSDGARAPSLRWATPPPGRRFSRSGCARCGPDAGGWDRPRQCREGTPSRPRRSSSMSRPIAPRWHRRSTRDCAALIEHANPPSGGQPAIDVLVSSDTARVGEQVDVVTLAWFPRDLRLQLRRPPTLLPPVIDGVWSYPQATPTSIAATRQARGRWFDLFVSHQIVFPLVAGRIDVPGATLKYSTPVALQFFSQEERYSLTSEPKRSRSCRCPGRPPGDVQRGDRLRPDDSTGESSRPRRRWAKASRWSCR